MLCCSAVTGAASDRVQSPDGRVSVGFSLGPGGVPTYEIAYSGAPIVLPSRLGFEPDLEDGITLLGTSTREHAGEWTNDFGERRGVPDNYRELTVDLRHVSGRQMQLVFRAYDEGAAFRYSFPPQEVAELSFSGERTEFRLPPGTYGWEAHGTEGEYRRVPTGEIAPFCERPLTLEYANGAFASLAEAANVAYPRMLLSPSSSAPGALVSALGGRTSNTAREDQVHDPSVRLRAGESSPWRLLVVGEEPGDLLERNYLLLNLNPPSALAETSWITPGKAMRDTTLTTANSKAIIDFADTGGFQFVHLDWKWYGSEDAEKGDATTVRVPDLDIAEIVRYGRQKGVGLIVYVDRRQIRKQREVLFPLFEEWGIRGVKIGFADVGPQEAAEWISETIRKAAEHHLMLNIHDGYRATGNNRTWPNLMTVEGIRGNEHMPTPQHNCTLPFTRYLSGPGDYTVCYYEDRLKTTHAHQLAMAVVSFSPLQWLYWYDMPSEADDESELEFFRQVPTVWDETRVLAGEIGSFAAIARRRGDEWFVGTINGSQPRKLTLPLAFLEPGPRYVAHTYFDDETAPTRTRVGVAVRAVDSRASMDVELKAGGGHAMWILPRTLREEAPARGVDSSPTARRPGRE